MEFLINFSIQDYLGISADIIILALVVVVVILLIVVIINKRKTSQLRAAYESFMEGKDGMSLEDTLIRRVDQIDELIMRQEENQKTMRMIVDHLDGTFQKVGLVKYDAFNEMGGKLSFTLALLNRKNTGFVMNAMHTREGCYTYVKEIIAGNPIVLLSEEEHQAVQMAIQSSN